jgi:hypothetical protein
MPRDGAIVFGDLAGKLDVLAVECAKCGRRGRYALGRLIERQGRDGKLIDWKDELTADCPRKIARNISDQCGAQCPDLPKVVQPPRRPPTETASGRGAQYWKAFD